MQKTSRKQATSSPRTTRTAAAGRSKRTSAELATQLERISHDLEDLRDLRTEMQQLRAGFEAFARQIEALLRPQHRGTEEPQATPSGAAGERSFETLRHGSAEAAEDEDTEEPTSALD